MTLPPPPEMRFGPLTITDFVRYAGASGDFNPLHHDPDFAQAAGLPSVMAHGMLSAGLLGSFLSTWFGPGSVRRYKVRFSDRVWPGDVLIPQGQVVRTFASPDGSESASLELTLVRDGGGTVISGSAEIVVRGAGP
ncbi:MAG: MaoC/PaaZ C-terminal domain-containing protein [Hyphomicrobiaceae bacterium]